MAKYIVQHRRGTAAQWDKTDIIPKRGEIVIEIDEKDSLHKLKIGDGIHTYSELAYLKAGDEVVTQVLAEARPRVVSVTLDAEKWTEVTCNTDPNLGYYGQTVAIEGITEYSRLDLQPSADMLAEFQKLNLVFVTENKGGIITVYSVGDMPLKSYTMQASIVETAPEDSDKVVGIPVGTPTLNADWNQTDETKADYIKNKPTVDQNYSANSTNAQSGTAVAEAIAQMVDSAPETLDTLNELSKALGDNPNFATTVATEIGKKVDKVDGKMLSTNDYTTEEKNKLAAISEGAEVNVQSDWNQGDEAKADYIKNKPPISATEDGAIAVGKFNEMVIKESGETIFNCSVQATSFIDADGNPITATITQPDWAQNDENADDFVKHRTHYSEYEFLNFEYTWDSYYNPVDNFFTTTMDCTNDNLYESLKNAISFKIKWNNQIYTFSQEDIKYSSDPSVWIGLSVDIGFDVDVYVTKYLNDNSETITFDVALEENVAPSCRSLEIFDIKKETGAKQLDEKYIPDTIARADLSNIGNGLTSYVNATTKKADVTLGGGTASTITVEIPFFSYKHGDMIKIIPSDINGETYLRNPSISVNGVSKKPIYRKTNTDEEVASVNHLMANLPYQFTYDENRDCFIAVDIGAPTTNFVELGPNLFQPDLISHNVREFDCFVMTGCRQTVDTGKRTLVFTDVYFENTNVEDGHVEADITNITYPNVRNYKITFSQNSDGQYTLTTQGIMHNISTGNEILNEEIIFDKLYGVKLSK